jgi:membrane protease YdiL (CAAX protease family)
MMRLQAFAERRPIVFAFVVTVGFLLLLTLPEIAVRGRGDETIEAAGILTRAVIAAGAFGLASALGWRERAGLAAPRRARPWALIVLPLVYLGLVYPFLFTGSFAPNLRDPGLTALVGGDAFAAGVMEELIFRGLIFYALLRVWGRTRAGIVRASVVSSLFFSLPHVTNIFFGHQPLRVGAQILWAFLLGVAFAFLVYAGSNVWPTAFTHGAIDAIVTTNRMGKVINLTPSMAVIMVLAAIPVLIYAYVVMRKTHAASSVK